MNRSGKMLRIGSVQDANGRVRVGEEQTQRLTRRRGTTPRIVDESRGEIVHHLKALVRIQRYRAPGGAEDVPEEKCRFFVLGIRRIDENGFFAGAHDERGVRRDRGIWAEGNKDPLKSDEIEGGGASLERYSLELHASSPYLHVYCYYAIQ